MEHWPECSNGGGQKVKTKLNYVCVELPCPMRGLLHRSDAAPPQCATGIDTPAAADRSMLTL
jgi:hypothetical protein